MGMRGGEVLKKGIFAKYNGIGIEYEITGDII